LKLRVVSGARPTGRLHIGNYFGSLKNWVRIQNENQYDCYFFIADWHSLTTAYENPSLVGDNLFSVFVDMLSVGLDPEKSTLFLQSLIPQHSELFLIYSMITPVSWLERNPTVKEMIRDLDIHENVNLGLLAYPVLQASDITLYKGNFVPIGKDQLPHLEITREIVRRFNTFYGNVFPEPMELLTDNPYLIGLDGRKMSKSLGNTIPITSNTEEIWEIVKNAVTDPGRVYRKDPGHPEICNVYKYYQVFAPESLGDLKTNCENASIGCMDCKKKLSSTISSYLLPFYEKKMQLTSSEQSKKQVREYLIEGSEKAKKIAISTIQEIKDIFHFEVKND
jgi:tryptophanyl-tRNA synthetase